jgi:hypothetical protein
MATDPEIGHDAEVVTMIGRRLRGCVRDIHPGYEHSFGRPSPEWVRMKNAIRDLVQGTELGE